MNRFMQVDVFSSTRYSGNPVAVVFDADKLSVNEMQTIARWTNLSETTFVQSPTDRDADYRVRIFSPQAELPFAGHPSVGTAHAVIEAGLIGSTATNIIQQCGAGLISLTVEGEGTNRKIFVTSPKPTFKPLPVDEERGLGSLLGLPSIEGSSPLVIDVGARWLTLELPTESTLRNELPSMGAIVDLSDQYSLTGLTVYALVDDENFQVCVRSFAPAGGVQEDPVCGSGNVCVAAHLHQSGRLELVGSRYTASQGREMGRDGYVTVQVSAGGEEISIGGRAITCVSGHIDI